MNRILEFVVELQVLPVHESFFLGQWQRLTAEHVEQWLSQCFSWSPIALGDDVRQLEHHDLILVDGTSLRFLPLNLWSSMC